jgi:hypothetical protein
MSNGKGKERAKASDEDGGDRPGESTDASSPTTNSIFDRVAASATGLARSAFATPSANELNDAVAASSTKSFPTNSNAAFGESSRASQESFFHGPQNRSAASFRGSQAQEHVSTAEAEFSSFLDEIEAFQPSIESNPQAVSSFEQAWVRPQIESDQTSTVVLDFPATSSHTVKDQEDIDGWEVLNILDNPIPESDSFYASQSLEDDIVEWNLTEEQRSMLRTLAKELFPTPEAHSTPDPLHPLNLLPAMVRSPDTHVGLPLADTNAEESYMYFGQASSQDEAQSLWMDQWEGVLTRYTDEVWGDLLPLIKEAQQEVEAIKEAPTSATEPKALRRLGLLLGHFK